MVGSTLINATDLTEWSSRLDARSTLPRVIRRLIHATADRITRIGFPANEGIQLGGWDGVVSVLDCNAFIPDGDSVWELSTENNVKSKADNDYEKRTSDPLGLNPVSTAFVFVTTRRWGGKNEWVRKRQDEGIWRDIRAYDADDLEQWLELAPAVHIWLLRFFGNLVPETAEGIGNKVPDTPKSHSNH